jgi:hypothetical protein
MIVIAVPLVTSATPPRRTHSIDVLVAVTWLNEKPHRVRSNLRQENTSHPVESNLANPGSGEETEMPRRPGGGEAPPDTLEAGLRRLAVEAGPTVLRLLQDRSPGIRAIMNLASPPDHWPQEDVAGAVLQILDELVEEIANPRWRASCKAALRIPADDYPGTECDSVAGRWRTLARREGVAEGATEEAVERYRGYWTVAAVRLAEMLSKRLFELNRNGGWISYQQHDLDVLSSNLPISFDCTDVLFQFDKQRGTGFTSYIWLTAHGPVDHYDTMGWYYNDPDAEVDIVPLANCSLAGPLLDLPQGGRSASLAFSRQLNAGEEYFFAYATRFVSDRPCRPTILYKVRGMSMDQLTIRAQFDVEALPLKIWYVDVAEQLQGSAVPDDGDPQVLEISSNGYVSYEFVHCKRGREYGLRWIWGSQSAPPLHRT